MINFKGFQNLYQHIKQEDPRVFDTINKVHDYIRQLADIVNSISSVNITYSTHAQRLALSLSSVPNNSIYIEYDRTTVYLKLGAGWIFLFGTMYGTAADITLVTDLGILDTGFRYKATDNFAEWRWNGASFVLIQPVGYAFIKYATAPLTLPTTPTVTDITGATINVPVAGKYLITAHFDMNEAGAGDIGSILVGYCNIAGAQQTQFAEFVGGALNDRATVGQQWYSSPLAVNDTIKLSGTKSGGTGTSSILSANTSLSGIWIGT